MPRVILDESQIHPDVRDQVSTYQREIVEEVERAARENTVLVVGMAQNPWPRRVRKLLDSVSVPYKYLEYGSYLSDWRRRSALKMWTGWPTFPMVFIKGTFVGGYDATSKLIASGEHTRLLNAKGV